MFRAAKHRVFLEFAHRAGDFNLGQAPGSNKRWRVGVNHRQQTVV